MPRHVDDPWMFYQGKRLPDLGCLSLPVDVPGRTLDFSLAAFAAPVVHIDEMATEEVLKWTQEDGRPEKVGMYRDVWGMRIDSSRVGDAKVFRAWGWPIALIVREEIRDALERLGATGTEFQEV